MDENSNVPTPLPSSDAPPPRKQSQRKRGVKSSQRHQENQRYKINQKVMSELDKKFDAIRFYEPLAEALPIERATPVVSPPVQVTVRSHTAIPLIHDVISVLYGTCKIQGDRQYDLEQLMWVTSFQLACKVCYARSNSIFWTSIDIDIQGLVKRIPGLFNTALLPLAVYLDFFGKFEHDGQTFIPTFDERQSIDAYSITLAENKYRDRLATQQPVIPDGFTRTERIENDRVVCVRIRPNTDAAILLAAVREGLIFEIEVGENRWYDFSDQFLRDPIANPSALFFVDFEYVEMRGAIVYPDLDELSSWYAGFLGRVEKRLSTVVKPVFLTDGKGNEVQIVGTKSMDDSYIQSTSNRRVRDTSLLYGAIFRIGGMCPVNNKEAPIVQSLVDAAGGITHVANMVIPRRRE